MVQLFWEALTIQMRQQIETAIGIEDRPVRAAAGRHDFAFILISNWLSVPLVQFGRATVARRNCWPRPRTSTTFGARAVRSFHSATTRQASGAVASFRSLRSEAAEGPCRGPRAHQHRRGDRCRSRCSATFGNMFAGGILVALIAMFPGSGRRMPSGKTFDLFVGLIQAFIFRAADHPVLQPVDGTRRAPP